MKFIKYKKQLDEMAYTQSDAINRCASQAEPFIDHFKEILAEPAEVVVNHWANEMQSYLNSVLKIVLKRNNKKLSIEQLIDWFFTMGSTVEVLFENDPVGEDAYNRFIEDVIKTKDVKQSLVNIGLVKEELMQNKETNEAYADKEERNYRRQINASNKLKDNKEKVSGKLSEDVIDTIESIVTHRHDLHKTDRENGNALIYHMNDLYDDIQQLPEDIRPHISFLDTDPRESEDVPLDFASDFFDSKDLCDFFLGEGKYETEEDGTPTDEAIDNAFIELYRYNDMIVETINTEIENWLGQIDKKYGTSYRPTGSNRLL